MWWLRWLVSSLVRRNSGVLLSKARDQVVTGIRRHRYAETVRKHGPAAEAGDAEAQYILGCACYAGKGTEQDLALAAAWFGAAAQQGHAGAQGNLAVLLYNGLGVAKDPGAATQWLAAAAVQGNVRAQYSLAVCHERGEGTPVNGPEAARLYRLAAVQGYVPAQRKLGHLLEVGGVGIAPNAEEAYAWYTLASEQQDVEAAHHAARMDGVLGSRAKRRALRRVRAAAARPA